VNRNVKTVLAASVLFGASTGIYEFVLPYYLKERGLSFSGMATVFAVAAAGMLLLRILTGRLADVWGRKLFYGLSLGGSALAMGITPLSASVLGQTALKTLREAMFLTRETLHPVVLYEEHRERFRDFIGKTRGMDFLCQGGGTLLAGALFVAIGTRGNLWLGAAMLALGYVIFLSFFRERIPAAQDESPPGRLRDLFSLDLHRNLKVIMVSFFIFNIGFTTSHCFIMPLFFSEKFGVSESAVSVVMLLHRVTIGLPLLLAGTLAIRNLKAAYIGALTIEGIIISASAVIPNFLGASAVWLLHDLVGAGIWIPVQQQIIQDHTRSDQRALQVGKMLAYSGVGTIIGPWLAGWLLENLPAHLSISAPFFASGVLMIIAAMVLFALRLAPVRPGTQD
jgi:predicted MFS family arabinose efflux permease